MLDRAAIARSLSQVAALEEAGLDLRAVLPVSALRATGIEPLVSELAAILPEGPAYFPGGEVSDQPREIAFAEVVREQALRRTREEIPHSIEVKVEEIADRDALVVVRAVLWVETESQKGILIGAGGRMIRSIGTAARKELERRLGKRAHLDLTVKVRHAWRKDDSLLDRLGIEP
jgi:GTP-binding protein Era